MDKLIYESNPIDNYHKLNKNYDKDLLEILNKQINIIKKFSETDINNGFILIHHLIENNSHSNFYVLILISLCMNKNKNIYELFDYIFKNIKNINSLIKEQSYDKILITFSIFYNNYDIYEYFLINNIIRVNIEFVSQHFIKNSGIFNIILDNNDKLKIYFELNKKYGVACDIIDVILIHHSDVKQKMKMVELLLKKGYNIDNITYKKFTDLIIDFISVNDDDDSKYYYADQLKNLLIKYGMNIDKFKKSNFGCHLHIYLRNELQQNVNNYLYNKNVMIYYNVIKMFVDLNYDINKKPCDYRMNILMMFCAIMNVYNEKVKSVVDLLIDNGITINEEELDCYYKNIKVKELYEYIKSKMNK